MIPEKAFQKGILIKTNIGHVKKLLVLFCYVRYIENADFQKKLHFFSELNQITIPVSSCTMDHSLPLQHKFHHS